ncbi:NAD-dependent epimerase/dehydratase family protein [Paenibacillus sp. MER TA 81-3]|uniref:NAD-dependent epimerase/dehydratase family protein n=1 Tax=Paenibacillus sp. MER TA 81-3 TaxID=2939573 RepID=UPI00203E0C83|nr:NAD-dependent epimerase/dehydratase family protein [Paenibacillus sp. MER TA 81-3]MCM3340814.1 NAD-dependent epimerase/dehydratase family protein [Paenibacillus sp. MER TA 81-3]
MMSRRALVTGGTGFLGQRLAFRLLEEGYAVSAIGRNARAGHELELMGVQFIPLDLCDAARVKEACRGHDTVFHCAALSAPWGAYADFYASNVIGTRHVVQGCVSGGARLVHVSTPSIYWNWRDRLNISEAEPLPPKQANAYAATKLLAEREVDQAVEEAELHAITLRPRAIFGPGDRAILPRLIEANRVGYMPLIRGGRSLLDVTYVDNVVDALLLSATASPAALGGKYNITNGEPMLLSDMLAKLFALLDAPFRPIPLAYPIASAAAGLLELHARWLAGGKEPRLTRYTVGLIGRSQTLDITAAREKLGYKPRISIEEGMRQFAEAWTQEGGAALHGR